MSRTAAPFDPPVPPDDPTDAAIEAEEAVQQAFAKVEVLRAALERIIDEHGDPGPYADKARVAIEDARDEAGKAEDAAYDCASLSSSVISAACQRGHDADVSRAEVDAELLKLGWTEAARTNARCAHLDYEMRVASEVEKILKKAHEAAWAKRHHAFMEWDRALRESGNLAAPYVSNMRANVSEDKIQAAAAQAAAELLKH